MKITFYVTVVAILLFSCTNQSNEGAVKESNPNSRTENPDFDWLLGSWVRIHTNDSSQTTFENWKKRSETEYIGFGCTLEGTDTVWQERISLIEQNGKWSFDVTGVGDLDPTRFALTSITSEDFTCENAQNEFPKMIQYRKGNDMLHAKISDEEMEVRFDFVRNE